MRYLHDIQHAPAVAANREQAISLNCRLIASAAVEVEKRGRDDAIDIVEIPLYGPSTLDYDERKLADLLEELFLYVLVRRVEVRFLSRPIQESLIVDQDQPQADAVCLYSGGIDSYSGILQAATSHRSLVGVFCAHSDQSRMIEIVRSHQPRLRDYGVQTLVELRVPPLGARGYIQLRGFLYVVSAGTVLSQSRASTLFVTECGPTMFQPRFSLLDSITMTTHPEVLRLARECLGVLLMRSIVLATPHANLTKAEVMLKCPDPNGLWKTHSCISQRFGDHDGTCYGCIVRRLASTAAGIRDTRYRRNPIWDEKANGGNLLELLRFSTNLLANPKRLQDFQQRSIAEFKVRDLFQRFALDNLAAIHSIRARGGKLRGSIKQMLEEVDRKHGEAILESRLTELRKLHGAKTTQ